MIATTERRYSLDAYRAIAETAKEKCEYHDGEIITMTSGTLNHSCGVYADAMIFDGKPQLNGDRKDEALNPLLIVEVLSPSTEEYDRTDKFRMYRSIPSFCEYLLIRQNKVFVERYSKQENVWTYSDFDGLDQSILLESVNIELAIAEIYRDIDF
jgi:Uma2 family endonuclease